MVTNKEKVFEFIVEYTKELNTVDDEILKFDTNFLSRQLGIQRSNVSTILNQLVEEGKIIKYGGRPVLYSLSTAVRSLVDDDNFKSLIGYDGSLKQAIQHTKAAIAYPKRVPKILYVGEKGTGVQLLSKEAYEYACSKGLLKRNAPYFVVNCSRYNEEQLERVLISEDALVSKCDRGLLLLKNADSISPFLIEKIMDHYLEQENLQLILMLHITDENKAYIFKDYFNFIVNLPPLKDRSLEERFQLIETFFRDEASRLDRRIEVNIGLMQCMMLYPCDENCDRLQKDIQFGVANAFIKTKKRDKVKLELSDLPIEVRRGLLYINDKRNELEKVIKKDISSFIFEKDQTYRLQNKDDSIDIYRRLDIRQKLLGNSINNQEADSFVFANIESELNEYLQQLTDGFNDEKLEKTVSEKMRSIVQSFVNKASQSLNKVYSKRIYYGICLHLNNAVIITKPKQRISNEKVMEIMDMYEEEYIIARKFIKEVQNSFNVKFSIDETIFITLFLSLNFENTLKESEVVVLIAMHGETTASSIVEVIQHLIPVSNIEAFDLSLNDDIDSSYDKLKQKIVNCNQGKGVLVIYDMGSIQVMLNSIMEETKI